MAKELLIISDDFGMSPGINQGIESSLISGVIRASNFMVPTPWFNEAFSRAKKNNLPVGVHLNITCEWQNFRWGPLTTGKTIRTQDGGFHHQYNELYPDCNMDEVYSEYKAQVKLLKDRNWNITHIDSHMLMPKIWLEQDAEKAFVPIIEQVAKEEGLKYLYGCDGNNLRYFDSMAMLSGMPRSDKKPEIATQIELWLRNLKEGRHFLVSHCAADTDELDLLTTPGSHDFPWTKQYRQEDFRTLHSDWFSQILKEEKISLISVNQL